MPRRVRRSTSISLGLYRFCIHSLMASPQAKTMTARQRLCVASFPVSLYRKLSYHIVYHIGIEDEKLKPLSTFLGLHSGFSRKLKLLLLPFRNSLSQHVTYYTQPYVSRHLTRSPRGFPLRAFLHMTFTATSVVQLSFYLKSFFFYSVTLVKLSYWRHRTSGRRSKCG